MNPSIPDSPKNEALPVPSDAAVGPVAFGELMSVEDFEKSLADIEAKDKALEKFMRRMFRFGQHYGAPYPGSDKLTMKKGGNELLWRVFNHMPRPVIDERYTVIDRDRKDAAGDPDPLFFIVIRTELVDRRTGRIVGYGYGACNSNETKYRYRDAKRKCPECDAEAIRKSKAEWGGGWYCNSNRDGGCGAKFAVNDPRIIEQEVGKVRNEDVEGLFNTILKMAEKRANGGVTLTTYGLSGMFDAERDEEEDGDKGGEQKTAETTVAGGKEQAAADQKQQTAPPAIAGEDERRALYDAYMKAGHNVRDVTRWVKEAYGIDMTRAGLPRDKYAEILARVSKPAETDPLFPQEPSCLCPDAPKGQHFPECPKAPQQAAPQAARAGRR